MNRMLLALTGAAGSHPLLFTSNRQAKLRPGGVDSRENLPVCFGGGYFAVEPLGPMLDVVGLK